MKNIITIPFKGVAYPFRNFGMLLLPFFVTLLVFGVLMYVLFDMDILAAAEGRFGSLLNIAMNVAMLLIVLLAVVPLLVGVVRHIVLGEKIEPFVLKNMFMGRTLAVVFGWIKLVVAGFIPLLLAALLVSLIEGIEFARMGGQVATVAAGETNVLSIIGLIIMILGLLGMFIVIARGSMIMVSGALDRGVSLRTSFEVTKHRTVLILLTLIGLMILTGLLLWLLLLIASQFGFGLDVDQLLALSQGGKLVLTAVVVFVRLLIAVMFIAVLAKLYLVLTTKS